jgi:protein-S-isoprenylcysteine O-methyltransferase Ste14
VQKRGIGAQEMGRLLTKGAYGISRHPIYLSHMLIYFGLVFERGAFEALIISPLVIVIYVLTAKNEEKFSIGKIFKDEYDVYKKRVPMFMKWWLFLIICVSFLTFVLISFNFGLLQI